jgi:triacylglycerol lipase
MRRLTLSNGRVLTILAVVVLACAGSAASAFADCWDEFAECAEWEWPEEECEAWENSEKEVEEEEEGSFGLELPEAGSSEEEEAEEEAGHNPILFVHGFRGGYGTWTTMIGRFLGSGWNPARLFNWRYAYWQSNVGTAAQVSTAVNEVLAQTGAKKLDLITHSMGSLPTRYYIKNIAGGAGKVDEFVSLSGPNHGTYAAYVCPTVSCFEMRPGSTFLNELNAGGETPGGVNYGTWRSVDDWVIVPTSSVSLGGATTNTLWVGLSHGGMHENAQLFEEVREFVRF